MDMIFTTLQNAYQSHEKLYFKPCKKNQYPLEIDIKYFAITTLMLYPCVTLVEILVPRWYYYEKLIASWKYTFSYIDLLETLALLSPI